MSASSTISSTLTSTSAASAATTSSGSDGGNHGPSSPLLFFVALGFGVVFTNLWIIVGVKYCFRYNQRNRQRMHGDDPDAVDLGAMPRQRRRREKKLMSIDEVNEKFPLIKYKAWRATRAAEGLSTSGGITTTTASRPASIHNTQLESKEAESQELAQTATVSTTNEKVNEADHGKPELIRGDTAPNAESAAAAASSDSRPKSSQSNTSPPVTPVKNGTQQNDDEVDEDDQIQIAVPAEQLPDPGDACAICIDTIEEEDDVRGLHCGHAFHASCVDPWLTSRRACCPLCKADYYVPKPRPEGVDAEGRRRPDGSMPGHPQGAVMAGGRGGHFGNGPRRPVMILPGRFMTIVYDERDRYGFPRVVREPRPGRPTGRQMRQTSAATVANPETIGQENQNEDRSWRRRLTAVRIPNPIARLRGNSTNGTQPENPIPATPAQLEAGRA